jgi:hypothetical protein
MKGTSIRHQFILWFSSSQRLAYIHVVEVSHKGYGISLDPLLSHTYPKAIGGGFSLRTKGVLQTSWSMHTKIGELPSTL